MRRRSADNFMRRKSRQIMSAARWILIATGLLPLALPAAGDTAAAATTTGPALPYTVGSRVDELFFYPCNDCHGFMDPNDNVRELDVDEGHPPDLEHGGGLFWCFSCHDQNNYEQLQTPLSKPLSLDASYRVCNGCHSQKFRDWQGGAHGKRAANWRGERQLFSCVECHNPHRPEIAPRAPQPPPPVRAGLHHMTRNPGSASHDPRQPEWEHSDVR